MYYQQFYLGCLASASYLIGADGEAAVVEPQRDVEQYLQAAAAHGFPLHTCSKRICTPMLSAAIANSRRAPGRRSASAIKRMRPFRIALSTMAMS